MGVMLAAGVAALGSGLSFLGASKSAKSITNASRKARREEQALYDKWSGNFSSMMDEKEGLLSDLGGVFERFESTGAFGDTDTLANLRKAQSDFSALAAGDFSGFEAQLRKSMSDALVNTVGSGSPIGAYAGLAADAQMNYRLQGVQTASDISEFLGNQANQLLGFEFGLMDQRFEVGYNMDKTRLDAINAYRMKSAANSGAQLQAAGGFVSGLGGAIGNVATYNRGLDIQNQQLGMQRQQLGMMSQQLSGGAQMIAPTISSSPSLQSASYTSYNPRSSMGSVTEYPDLPLIFPPDNIDLGPGVLPVRNDIPQQVSSTRASYPPYSNPLVPQNSYADSMMPNLLPQYNFFQ